MRLPSRLFGVEGMNRLTDKAQREMEGTWRLRQEAVELLRIIVAEWYSDPLSVQCFDLRIVERAREIVTLLLGIETWEKHVQSK